VSIDQRELHRKLLSQALASVIEAIFAGPVLLAEGSHRHPTLFLLRDELPPEVQTRRLCLRHAASTGDRPPPAKWCSSDAYECKSYSNGSVGLRYERVRAKTSR
jgi:hypothetical protein